MLTIKNNAPSNTAFSLTSKSTGKEMPKLSASVNISLASPPHFFEILPISSVEIVSSFSILLEKIWNSTSEKQASVQHGPTILKISTPSQFFTVNFGVHHVHSCSTVPASCPSGAYTAIDWKSAQDIISHKPFFKYYIFKKILISDYTELT